VHIENLLNPTTATLQLPFTARARSKPMPSQKFLPTAPLANLKLRSDLLHATRAFFHQHGFLEVQTPVLSRHCVIDRHLDPFVVVDESNATVRFFQTSPEQGMKRLLAAGMERIYQLGPVFRAGEYGKLHNPEFTMLEWYRVGDDLQQGITLLDQIVRAVINSAPAQSITYQAAFQRATQVDPLSASMEEIAAWCIAHGHVDNPNWSDDRDDWLDLIFSLVVQPQLGNTHPEIVTHFPASQSALAKITPNDPSTCERFELFIDGVELANGYHELLDAQVLRERNSVANRFREQAGKLSLPEENLLLDAMESGLPACTGCALGFDRLVMIAAQAKSIDQVLCFPWDRA
jgi:lysyl-tRNA synthetase class 2